MMLVNDVLFWTMVPLSLLGCLMVLRIGNIIRSEYRARQWEKELEEKQ